MKQSEVKQALKDLNIDDRSISFFQIYDHDANEFKEHDDSEFGTCEISGYEGNLVNCTARDVNGNIVNFQALDSLVAGALGKIAGAH